MRGKGEVHALSETGLICGVEAAKPSSFCEGFVSAGLKNRAVAFVYCVLFNRVELVERPIH